MTAATGVYVLSTERGYPPRALLYETDTEELETPEEISGALAIWTADLGCWTLEGHPLPQELSEVLTERAKELGVPWR